MAKVLTVKEMAEIVNKLLLDPCEIDDVDQFREFVGDVGDLITKHCGGERGGVDIDMNDDMGWVCCFRVNGDVPEDGGIFSDYDKDVTWCDGVETQK
jgi:hypothetical protein